MRGALPVPIESFSYHNPGQLTLPATYTPVAERIAGLWNADGAKFKTQYFYASDSRGGCRRIDLPRVVRERREERLYVLTHPVRWTPQPVNHLDMILAHIGHACLTMKALAEHTVSKWTDAEIRKDGSLHPL